MRRSFIKKSRGRSRRSLRRMRGGSAKYAPKYQYWKERDTEKRDVQRQLAKGSNVDGSFDRQQPHRDWEQHLAIREDNYVKTLRASFNKPYLAQSAEAQYDTLMQHYNDWPPILSGKEEWIDPKDVYTNSSE